MGVIRFLLDLLLGAVERQGFEIILEYQVFECHFGRDYRFCVSGSQDNGQRLKCRPCQGLHLHSPRSSPGSAAGVRFPAEDLHLVPAPIKELAVVLVVEGIAGDSENPLLESCEFEFEFGLVHRTIVRFVKVSFHAVKI